MSESSKKIELHNVNSGERVPTYFIRDKRGTGDISFNSSAVCNWLVGDFFHYLCLRLFQTMRSLYPKG
ncbi:aspartate 1-decarboxylase [Undibacterium arcticum]